MIDIFAYCKTVESIMTFRKLWSVVKYVVVVIIKYNMCALGRKKIILYDWNENKIYSSNIKHLYLYILNYNCLGFGNLNCSWILRVCAWNFNLILIYIYNKYANT